MCEEYYTNNMCRQLAGITPLLEVEDMVKYTKPDWKCVFTYVQSFYRRWGIIYWNTFYTSFTSQVQEYSAT